MLFGLMVVVLDDPRALKLQQKTIEMNTPEGGAEALLDGSGCFNVAVGLFGLQQKKIEMNTPKGGAEALFEGLVLSLIVVRTYHHY